jgi:hypothetical protein
MPYLANRVTKRLGVRVLGLDGTRGGGSPLDIKYKLYASLESLLEKDH